MTAAILNFSKALTEREFQDRGEWAQQEAGWYFNKAVAPQKAAYDLALEVARGCVGPVWDRKRTAARKAWAEDTKEARALFDRTVEWFLSHSEMSDELDNLWTELFDRPVAVAMAAE